MTALEYMIDYYEHNNLDIPQWARSAKGIKAKVPIPEGVEVTWEMVEAI